MHVRKYILVFFVFLCFNLFGQKQYNLFIVDKEDTSFIKQKNTIDSATLSNPYRLRIVDSLSKSGYLNLDIDIIKKDSIGKIYIIKNERFRWAKISFDSTLSEFPAHLKREINKLSGAFISGERLNQLMNTILNQMDETGYPFATCHLDRIKFISDDSISGVLNLNRNKRFYFDTFSILSQSEISKKMLENYLEIRKGDVFQWSKFEQIPKNIQNITFLSLGFTPQIKFFGESAIVTLNLKPTKVNRFDFLLGLQPDQVNKSKYKLTGELLLDIVNKLGKGERLSLNYQNLSAGKQELNLKINYPFIMDMPFGLDSKFKFYLNQQHRDIDINTGLVYSLNKKNALKLYYENVSSRLVQIDSEIIINSMKLPDNLDFNINNLGLNYNINKLDYFFNPTHGFNIEIDLNGGQRKILKNAGILNLHTDIVDFSTAYDSVKLSTLMSALLLKVEYYKSIGGNFVIRLAENAGYKYTLTEFYQNELFRIGGNSTIRGFNEQSIFANFYGISTFEFRLLFTKNSFLFTYLDYGIVRDPKSKISLWDEPYGIGAGINFDTKNGLLQISAGLGSQYKSALNFNNANIHIGYISLFQ